MNESSDHYEMPDDVDFSQGTRGVHLRDPSKPYIVEIVLEDGTVEVHHYPARDAVILDSDLRRHFPTDESVNEALRSLLKSA
jgi:hypothetical protein